MTHVIYSWKLNQFAWSLMNKTSPKVFRLLTMEDSGEAQHVVDEDMKTASTIIMVSAVHFLATRIAPAFTAGIQQAERGCEEHAGN